MPSRECWLSPSWNELRLLAAELFPCCWPSGPAIVLCAVTEDSPAGDMSWSADARRPAPAPAPPSRPSPDALPPPPRDEADVVRAERAARRPYSRGDFPFPPAIWW